MLGGGVIGCEFASVWRSFGADVTIVEALPRLLPPEDAASSATLERAFRKRGITARTGTSVTGVTTGDDGVVVTLSDDTELRADVLLVAVGRVPRTEGLGYAEQGVTLDRGFVTVDDHCRTGVEGVWAVGDIVPGLQLAHRGFQQGIFVAEQIGGLCAAADRRARHPAGHLLATRGRVGRAHRGAGQGGVRRRRRSPRSPTTWPATGSPRSCAPRASSSWSARSTVRSWASTWSASGSAS